jgi:hypothetical protein
MGVLGFLLFKQGKPSTQAESTQEEIQLSSIATPATDDRQKAPYVLGMYSATIDRDSYLASDDNEWILYMRQPLRTYRKPGVTLHEEYAQWLAGRARVRRTASAVAGPAAERQAAS